MNGTGCVLGLIVGLTVAALVVPKALGDTGIVSVPIPYGLYDAADHILEEVR